MTGSRWDGDKSFLQDLVSATSRLLGRKTAGSGVVEELTASDVKTILAIASSDVSGLATVATSGSAADLTGTLDPARIAASALVYAKIQNVSATSRIMGRKTAGAGVLEELTAADMKTILALAAGDISGLAAIAASGSGADLTAASVTAPKMAAGNDFFTNLYGFPMTQCAAVQPIETFSGVALTAGRGYWFRAWGSGTITKIGLEIVATGSGNIDVAIYANTGTGLSAHPGALRNASSFFSGAAPGTGYRELALGASTIVSLGDWFYINTSTASMTFVGTIASSGRANLTYTAFAPIKVAQTNGTVSDPAATADARSDGGNIWMIGVA